MKQLPEKGPDEHRETHTHTDTSPRRGLMVPQKGPKRGITCVQVQQTHNQQRRPPQEGPWSQAVTAPLISTHLPERGLIRRIGPDKATKGPTTINGV